MIDKDNEEVLVVRTEKLFPEGVWEGFRQVPLTEILKIVETNQSFLKRKYAEIDPSWQQIIVQIILKCGQKVFIHRIPQTGSEKRLHDMWPIFIGGHINNIDKGIEDAIKREFEEEINYKGNIINKEFFGVVKLNNSEVNKVHTGLVWLFEGDSEEYEPTEDYGIIDGKFVEISDLKSYIDKMTYWSKTIAPYVIGKYK